MNEFGVMGLHIYSHEDEKISSADMHRRMRQEPLKSGCAAGLTARSELASMSRQDSSYFDRPYQ